MGRFIGVLGIIVILGLAYLFSTESKSDSFEDSALGTRAAAGVRVFCVAVSIGREIFQTAGDIVNRLLRLLFRRVGIYFGPLGSKYSNIVVEGVPVGNLFSHFRCCRRLFLSRRFSRLLYYLGVMQVHHSRRGVGDARIMGASGAESLNVAASIFMGQTEAPLTIRPFLQTLTRSELMTVMTSGMAHVSGGIMAAYIAFGVEAKHLLRR